MSFHWGDLYNPLTNVNDVTNPAFDPDSKQPERKFCAVRLRRVSAHNADGRQRAPAG